MSFLDDMRSHVYPTNLRLLPWNEALALAAQPLEMLRPSFVEACQAAFRTEEQLEAELASLPLRPFRDVVRDSGGTVEWSESFLSGVDKITVSSSPSLVRGNLGWRLQVSEYLSDWIILSDEEAARGLHTALGAMAGKPVDRDMLLALAIAPDAATRADYQEFVDLYGGTDHMAAIEAVVDRIDALVGPALGLDVADIGEIRRDMTTDPFLKNIVPRWPGTATRLHGYRTGLDSSERYA